MQPTQFRKARAAVGPCLLEILSIGELVERGEAGGRERGCLLVHYNGGGLQSHGWMKKEAQEIDLLPIETRKGEWGGGSGEDGWRSSCWRAEGTSGDAVVGRLEMAGQQSSALTPRSLLFWPTPFLLFLISQNLCILSLLSPLCSLAIPTPKIQGSKSCKMPGHYVLLWH